KDFILHWKENSGAIDEINYRQMVFHRDLLETKIFLTGNRKPCSGFHCLVVCDNHALPSAYISDTCHSSACRTASLFNIHIISGKRGYFNKWTFLIDKICDTFPRCE